MFIKIYKYGIDLESIPDLQRLSNINPICKEDLKEDRFD